jgi:hypothetical protein
MKTLVKCIASRGGRYFKKKVRIKNVNEEDAPEFKVTIYSVIIFRRYPFY